jgi:homoserine dehydrogenase
MLSDISALTYDYSYEYKKLKQEVSTTFSNDAVVEVLVSFREPSLVGPNDFEDFKGGYHGKGSQYMNGFVTLDKLRQWASQDGISVILTPTFNLVPHKQLRHRKELVS